MNQMKRCPKCGQASPLPARYCASCGHQFRTDFTTRTQLLPSPPPAQPTAQQQSDNVHPVIPLVLALFALLFLFFDPLVALILSLATLLYAHIRLRGVLAFAVSVAVLVAVACGVVAGYRAGWDAGRHRADMLEYQYQWTNRRDLPFLPNPYNR